MEPSFIQYLNFLKQFFRGEKASEVLILVLQQIYVLVKFSSPFNLHICTVNCITET